MGANVIEIPRRPIYYVDSSPIPLASRPVFPEIPPLDDRNETIARMYDPSSIAQRLRYDGQPEESRLRLGTSLVRGKTLELGNRVVNGVRFALAETSKYGIGLLEARDHELFEDHGHGHERRVMKWIGDIINNGHELRIEDKRLIFALSQFSDHDHDQLITEVRNVSRKQKGLPALDPKLGHGPAEALRQLATVQYLADEAGISLESARELRFLSAAMILLHDEPERLDRCLTQTEIPDGEKAYTINRDGMLTILRGKALMDILDKGVDLLSLRPSQIAEITWRMKEKKNGVKTEFVTLETPNGLDPVFEEQFKSELSTIAFGGYYRMGDSDRAQLLQEPLALENASLDFRQQFTLAMRIAEFADLMDKVIPAPEAALRKVTVDIATKRPFFRPGLIKRVTEQNGNLAAKDDSDAGRADWELRHVHERLEHIPGQVTQALSDSLYIRQLGNSIGIFGLIAQKKIGTLIMQGNEIAIEEFVRSTYDNQLRLLAQKYLSRTNIDFPPDGNIDQVIQILSANGHEDYAQRLAILERKNDALAKHTMDCLQAKPDSDVIDGKRKVKKYSPADIGEFRAAQDYFLMKDYKLSAQQIQELEQADLESETLFPFGTYYSSGHWRDGRSYRRHAHQQQRDTVLAA